jgi:prolyl-tRNA synthetase
MKVSKLVVKTLREVPSSAEMISHIFLLRGGYAKQMAAGLYSMLPLGQRVLRKIETILHEEMERIGGQEMDLPLIHPKEIWQESGRYEAIGDELLRFQDRSKHSMVLAMTHEEAVTDMMRSVLSSYKQLPCMVYQIKLKFRDEPRARGGLIRVREFAMKDAYSFHASEESLNSYYQEAYQAYDRIFKRVGIDPIIVQSDTGIMGGTVAHEFMLECDKGEDYLILSEDGSYKANQEVALFDRENKPSSPLEMEKVSTPIQKTIEEVSEFLGVSTKDTMKSVMFESGEDFILVLLRGDLNVSEVKVRNFLHTSDLYPASEERIVQHGLVPGFAGPIGIVQTPHVKILVDESVAESNNLISGANEVGYHLKNINFKRDFHSEWVGDFAQAEDGHKCIDSDSRLKATKGVEIGNIFKLGTKFSTAMKAEYLDAQGKGQPAIMGCYGIGVGRLMAAVMENSHDEFGPIWPKEIAPYQIHMVNIGNDSDVLQACEDLYQALQSEGFEVLYDDRNERPGVKFKDADLWGIPLRLAISGKTLANNQCEWKIRGEKAFDKILIKDVVEKVGVFYK